MGNSTTRGYKIAYLREKINKYFEKNPKGKLSKNKILADFIVSQNSTKRTGLEILFAMMNKNEISIDGDEITC